MDGEYKHFIEGSTIYLRDVRLSDVNDNYCRWMNDPETNQYMETRHSRQTPENIKSYVKKTADNPDAVFLAICLKEGDRHIWNIKLGPINWIHRSADISFFIGEKGYWGRGIATEAIKLIAAYGFNKLRLHRLSAGAYVNNLGSIKALEKAGFKEEGTRKESCFYDGKYIDEKIFGIIKNE